MPQSSDEMRAKMQVYFGDPVDDAGPMQYLMDQGFVLQQNWSWLAPDRIVSGDQPMSDKEKECVVFLIEEWDMDGVCNLEGGNHGR